MYVGHLKVNRNYLPSSWPLAFSNFVTSRQFVWEVGETVALVVCGPPTEIVNPQLVFELSNIGPVVSRNRRECGTPPASSVVTQQGSVEL